MWIPTEHEKYGVVIAGFRGTVPHGLSLEIGDTVQILEKCDGWYRGFALKNPNLKGIFPSNYIHLKNACVKNKGQFEMVVPTEDSVITEMTSTLRDWGTMWKQLYVRNEGDLFHRLWHIMNEILDLRRQVLVGHLTHDRMKDVKRHITARLDWGNEQLGLDLVPRKEYAMVDPEEISITELYRLMEHRHRKKDTPVPASSHHLFVQMKSLMCSNLGEELEVIFSLFDSKENRPISERFFLRLNRNGLPKCPEKPERHCSLFVDLGSSELRKDIYITVHIIRIGRMGAGEKKNACNVQYRRPFGCAVLSIADLLAGDSKDDLVLKVYMCNTESDWYQIHENIIKKLNARYNLTGSNAGLAVSLQLLHGDIEQIRREYTSRFTHGVSITRKLGFSNIIMPGEMRNDLYITVERGEFEKGGKSVARNVEVTMHVVDSSGQILKDFISFGSGEPPASEYHSFVLYHNNGPRWAELLKLPIPVDKFRGAHIRCEFRHCSTKEKGEKKLFGFSFVPLMQENGRTLPDGTHELIVHKCEENANLQDSGRYLKLPFSKGISLGNNSQAVKTTKESFWITSFLCSTKLTQNGDMLDLLKWRTHPDKIAGCLSKLKEIDGSEIVKFLQDTLDTLFGILDENSQKYGSKVFDCLVHIINLLQDSKFHHFKPVMDTYIESHFAGALAYRDLIKVLKWHIDRVTEVELHDHIQEVLKAQEYIFKYIVQSRRLFSIATGGQNEEEFRCCIQELLMSVRFFLSQESKGTSALSQLQAVFLSSFPSVYSELLKLFDVREVANLVHDALGSLPTVMHGDESLQAVKLQSIGKTVESHLYTNPDSRCILLPVVLHHLHMHLQEQKDLIMCARILSNIFCLIKKNSSEKSVLEEIDVIVNSLLDILLRTILEITSRPQPSGSAMRLQFQDVTGEFVSCLLSLLRQMTDRHYQQLLDSFSTKEDLRDFLLQIFTVFRILIRPEMFPKDWTVMRLVANNVIITTVLYLSDALRKNFLNENFDYKIWDSYFFLAVIFINQLCLQLEMFTPSKKKKVLEKYGDMRVTMGCEIFSMWQNLGEHKLHFIPALIGPFLEVTLIPQPDLRNVMIPIFHDMMDWEQRRSGNFKQVEAKLIDKLDSLMSEGKGDETYRELFNSILLKKIERETWRESGVSLIATVTRLMERLLDYRDCMKMGEVDGKKIGCTVSLLNFYKTELNKEEMYIRYIHKLYDLHLKAQNFTEAAYTLLLYDELLEWSDRPLREFLNYPMQTEWQRKECLHLTIIQNFDRGKCWENGIILCRKIAEQYESYYDYRNLSKMRMMEASLYDKIMDQQRLEPEFFRVGFYGKKFPFFLRNKEFVCRGHDYERLEAFQQRMLNEFPHAIAMQHANQPDETIFQAEAQYLQIYAVTPIPENQEVLQRDGIPDNIKSFYKVNHIWRFRYDRPFHKGTKDKENEFKSLWVERTTLILVQSLPGISRWFEVEKREVVEMSPLENAIEVLENKNQQLRTLISQCQTRQMQNINPLTMCLNGVIDAAVNGGVARYQEAFFVKEYILNHPEDGEKITRLRELTLEQAQILEFGLAVHEKVVPQDMRPLHKKLVDQFFVMKSSLGIQDFSACVQASPVHFPNGSPRVCRNSIPVSMSPDAARVIPRRSPLSYPAVNRYSSSSLSSQASAEVSNITGQSESSDEVFNMQPSPSTSSLSSTHSASPNVTSSAPSSARASPLLSDKHKHSRENSCLSPRERPCSAIYPTPLETSQTTNSCFAKWNATSVPHSIRDCIREAEELIGPVSALSETRPAGKSPNLSLPSVSHERRMLFNHIGDGALPRSDSNLPGSDKAVNTTPSSWSLDSGKEARSTSESGKLISPPVPPRPAQTASPARHIASVSPSPAGKSPMKGSVQSFTPSPVEYHSSGLISNSPALSGSYSSGISSLSRCSTSETSGFESQGSEPAVTVPSYSISEEPVRKESKTPPPYSVYERTLKRPVPLPHSLSIPPAADPPALPPKPQLVRPNNLENSSRRTEQVPRPRPLPRKVSQL
ncbi:dedicator of cytokinesis protein 4 isoform X2 [Melozone crissalis]|uniref:dedicator of cytokinesis protein 4 isoform X2 n=1 Tax=Melozone crissalis TaxID=40204 RepID=UPI0023DCA352|nr:dedicator of cytokinesis protein 4 isoform X2 [Melozone crissalis]